MLDKYVYLVNTFKELDEIDKEREIINQLEDMIKLVNIYKEKNEINDEMLPLLSNYSKENVLDNIFSYLVVLKEEYAKIIKNNL